MKLIPITDVCKEFDVTTRTLRYYEQIGLIQSDVKEDYAYRVYNGRQLEKLRQVLLLRKLRIPLKQIMRIFENSDTGADIGRTLDILAESMREAEDEINYLSDIKNALNLLTQKLKSTIKIFDDSEVLKIINLLSPSKKLNANKKTNTKETDTSSPYFNKLKNSEVRIITLPPATVASYYFEGDDAEEKAAAAMDDFVRKNDLIKIKPDLRRYGFSIINLTSEPKMEGYEMWVTIPDDFYIAPPLEKKRFEGGLYASYTVPFGEFDEWFLLYDWVANNDKYIQDYKGSNATRQVCLEELINYVFHLAMPPDSADSDMQLDLLMPIRIMENAEHSETNLKSMTNIKNKTLSQLEAEARQGDPVAQCDFAYCFFKGYHTEINYKKATEWYQKSAKQGYARAQCTLGYCYKKGLGLPKNEEKAAELFEKAAMQNSPAAMLNLAWGYMSGTGVARNYSKAMFWFEKAAAQNDNLRIKSRANAILNELPELINREDIKLEFHQPEDIQTIKKKDEDEQRTVISVVYTNLDY